MDKTRSGSQTAYLTRMPSMVKQAMEQLATLHHRSMAGEMIMAMEYWVAAHKKEMATPTQGESA